MNKLLLYFLIGSVALTRLEAQTALLPSCTLGGSIAPYVDADGYVNPILKLGEINFGNGLTLPLALNFSSKIRPPSAEFGQGWECPLLDAKIVDVQKDLKKVELLGGRVIWLVYNQRTNTWRHYYTDSWKGEAQCDEFDLTYETGVKFVFDKGLISSMTMPDGRTIVWNRTEGKVTSLQENGNSPALEILYDKVGFAKQLALNPDALGKARAAFDLSSSLVYAGLDRIKCPDGKTFSFDRSLDANSRPTMKWYDNTLPGALLTWDKTTGKILGDGTYTYQITEVNPAGTWPRMERQNLKTKRNEAYYLDQTHGTVDWTFADGTQRHIETIESPGPNYKKLRLIQETKAGKTVDVLRRAFDDDGHLLVETIGLANGKESSRQFVYDDAGRVVSYLFNGREMWKNTFDPQTGKLTRHVIDRLGLALQFESLPGGDVREFVVNQNGKVASKSTLSTAAWQSEYARMQQIN